MMWSHRLCRALFALFLVLAGGCATVHAPHEPIANPVAIFVVDYGIHTAVILPEGDDRFVEYSFGDFRFATAERNTPLDSIIAAFFSPGAGFGRNHLPADPVTGVPVFARRPESLRQFDAPADRVEALSAKLADRFARGKGPEIHNDYSGILWRRDDEHYTLVHNNCNYLTRRCLRDLGFDVRGFPIRPSFNYRAGVDMTVAGRQVYEAAKLARSAGQNPAPVVATPADAPVLLSSQSLPPGASQ